jgi:hypothetical protein
MDFSFIQGATSILPQGKKMNGKKNGSFQTPDAHPGAGLVRAFSRRFSACRGPTGQAEEQAAGRAGGPASNSRLGTDLDGHAE